MANHIFNIGLALGLVVAFGAAAQQKDRPANDAPRQQATGTAKKPDTARERNDISRDPDRSAIGPRTTQGLAQDAIARSNGR